MGNNNPMISMMFEEIKTLIASIDKKLEERAPVKENPSIRENSEEPNPEDQTKMIKPEQLIRLIAVHLQNAEQKIGHVSGTVRESEKQVLFQMEELKRITVSQKPDSNVHHHHIIELRSSKVVVAIISLSVLLLASLFGNIRLLDVKSRMSDNDLKYRHIQSTKGINREGLNKLEDVFQYHRDKKKIREIRDHVGDYERKVREATEKNGKTNGEIKGKCSE
ncbi:MAG: hypothetical protein WC384_18770 [Prolixibacteraceae bacterium]|jgi:hypothetical protein